MEHAQFLLADGILLIGDNHFLLRLVATNLAPLTATAILLGTDANPIRLKPDAPGNGLPCRLILLALSCSRNEPIVILARAGLTRLVGSIPLLIITDRPFPADPERHIYHLPFPFSAEELRRQIGALLAQTLTLVTDAPLTSAQLEQGGEDL
jgi:hypothetical protein